MDVVTVTGTVVTEPDRRATSDGRRLCSFMLALRRPGAPSGFLRVVAWDGAAERCARVLSNGSRASVSGRLESQLWEEARGRRARVDLVADAITVPGEPHRLAA